MAGMDSSPSSPHHPDHPDHHPAPRPPIILKSEKNENHPAGGPPSTSSVSSSSRPTRKPEGQLPSSLRISFSTWKVAGKKRRLGPPNTGTWEWNPYNGCINLHHSTGFMTNPMTMGKKTMFWPMAPMAPMVHDPTSARPSGGSYRRFLVPIQRPVSKCKQLFFAFSFPPANIKRNATIWRGHTVCDPISHSRKLMQGTERSVEIQIPSSI